MDAIFNTPALNIGRNIDGLTFDAVISEAHVSELQVTENPIESGVSISDHCFMRPLKVTIQAAVSDIKMPSASTLYDGSPSGRVRQAFAMLQDKQSSLASNPNIIDAFTVVTGLKTYYHMVVTSLTATQDAQTSSLLAFTAELSEIITVKTAAAAYTEPKPVAAGGKPKWSSGFDTSDLNKKQPQTITDTLSRMGVAVDTVVQSAEKMLGIPQTTPIAPRTPKPPSSATPTPPSTAPTAPLTPEQQAMRSFGIYQ
jgi:hypothetical protein